MDGLELNVPQASLDQCGYPRVARAGRDFGVTAGALWAADAPLWLGEEASGSKASQARDGRLGEQDGANCMGRHGEENELSVGTGCSSRLTHRVSRFGGGVH